MIPRQASAPRGVLSSVHFWASPDTGNAAQLRVPPTARPSTGQRCRLTIMPPTPVACCTHQVQNFDLSQRFWCRGRPVGPLVSTSKVLAQMNRSTDWGKATKGCSALRFGRDNASCHSPGQDADGRRTEAPARSGGWGLILAVRIRLVIHDLYQQPFPDPAPPERGREQARPHDGRATDPQHAHSHRLFGTRATFQGRTARRKPSVAATNKSLA